MFEFDICLCGNKEDCPKKDTCLRAINVKAGIYTYSLFYIRGTDCKEYIDKNEYTYLTNKWERN